MKQEAAEQANVLMNVADGTAVGVTTAAFFGVIPEITALITLVYMSIRLYETRTVQRIIYNLRNRNQED